MSTVGVPASKRRKPARTASGKPRKRPTDWEGNEQAVVMRWLLGESKRGSAVGQLHPVTYHVPNGGVRSWKTGAAMKAQGVKAGVSDLQCNDARGGWHGLCLEFKASPPHSATLAESQRAWLELMRARGYCAALAVGHEQAKAVLREYASWPRTEVKGERRELMAGTDWRK